MADNTEVYVDRRSGGSDPRCLCNLHSGFEEFRTQTRRTDEEQWKAINAMSAKHDKAINEIKNYVIVSALAALGTLVMFLGTLAFRSLHLL